MPRKIRISPTESVEYAGRDADNEPVVLYKKEGRLTEFLTTTQAIARFGRVVMNLEVD